MKILLAYPGPRHSTFDVAAGYERALRATGAEVEPYQYHSFIEYYECANRVWNERRPEFAANPGDDLYFASEHLVVKAVEFVPDVVLVIAGGALHRRAFDLLYRLRLPVVVLLTESPYQDTMQGNIIRHPAVVAALTNERLSAAPLAETAGKPVAYLPHAYDPARHFPQAVGADYQTDVYFHGTLWPEREALFAGLDALPYRVKIGGGRLSDIANYGAQTLPNDELAQYYCGTRIALNHHRVHTAETPRPAESLGPRAYEIAACGAFQLCDATRPELFELLGGTVGTYRDAADLRDKITYWLRRDAERERMAANARAHVQACTFAARAKNVLFPLLEGVL